MRGKCAHFTISMTPVLNKLRTEVGSLVEGGEKINAFTKINQEFDFLKFSF